MMESHLLRFGFWSILLLAGPFAEAKQATVVEGLVQDASGGALAGVAATMALTGAEETEFLSVTNAEGVFEFSGLASGTYRLDLSLPGFEEKTLTVEIDDGENVETPVTLEIVLELTTWSSAPDGSAIE